MSGDWLGDLKPQRFQVVFVIDQKDSNLQYWRHEYLTRPEVVANIPRKTKALEKKRLRLLDLLNGEDGNCEEFLKLTEDLVVNYKAGRKLPDYAFKKLKKLVYEAIRERHWTMFGQVGYEADDIAATIVKVNSELERPNRLILLTIDSDWMGLINQHTAWFCMTGWFPRVRSDSHSANLWANKRLGSDLEEFRSLWDLKVSQGDKSDNLPPGSPKEVIDLMSPPEEYRLWNQPIAEGIRDVLMYPKYRQVNPDSAIRYIRQLGVDLCVRPLDSIKDLAA